ncbi:MAG: hypothetical protein ABIQ54_03725 [Gammaproteobacteria bacterium]
MKTFRLTLPFLIILPLFSIGHAAPFPPVNTIYWEGDPGSARTITTKGRDAKLIQGASLEAISFSARLIDPVAAAQERAASVRVDVAGLAMTDPHTVDEQPKGGQGHLHYQIDNGPEIATTVAKLDFHELTPGTHKIKVMLVGNDHRPLGPQETLEVVIPR